MTHVARSEIAIVRLDVARMGEAGCACLADGLEACVERGALADGDSIDRIDGGRVTDGRGREVGLDGVVDVADVAAGFAVAVDEDLRAGEEGGGPCGADGGIGACGGLRGPKTLKWRR
ncbi:hypothetical protein [Thiocapsa sp.]|uniref:hypothetical protein n=1 Tax=Thiocapsa sp. TaxID=2024551 RepID=UPI0035932379